MAFIKKIIDFIIKWLKRFFTKQNCCKSVIIFSLVFNYANAQNDSSISKTNFAKIPTMDVKDLQGNTVNSSSFSNGSKPVLLVFWISIYKIPGKELDAIEENYVDWKKETGVKVIVISVDDSRTASHVLPMVNAKGWSFEFYLDINSDFKRAMNVNNLPHTFLINGSGEIVWQAAGFMEGNESLIYDELKKMKK